MGSRIVLDKEGFNIRESNTLRNLAKKLLPFMILNENEKWLPVGASKSNANDENINAANTFLFVKQNVCDALRTFQFLGQSCK